MDKKEKNKKRGIGFLSIVIGIGLGIVIGLILASGEQNGLEYIGGGSPLLGYLIVLILLYGSMTIHTVIHEAGHLVFGLLSGYRFGSFRIFSVMLLKDRDGFKIKRLSLAGTGGQCLMSPPDMVDGKIPVMMYNLGGAIFNLLFSVLFAALYFILPQIRIISLFLVILAILGVAMALLNGIPMRTAMVDNDGYNALNISRDPRAMYAFWTHMKINEQISMGVRLKDMPEEWFTVPSDEGMKNSMIAANAVFACNRLMDEGRFEAAAEGIDRILNTDNSVSGIYRRLLVCDRVSIELVTGGSREAVERLLDPEQKKFQKQMKNFISVIRTEYIVALLYEKDNAKAEKIRRAFEKRALTHPYKCDVESEREIIAAADKRSVE